MLARLFHRFRLWYLQLWINWTWDAPLPEEPSEFRYYSLMDQSSSPYQHGPFRALAYRALLERACREDAYVGSLPKHQRGRRRGA